MATNTQKPASSANNNKISASSGLLAKALESTAIKTAVATAVNKVIQSAKIYDSKGQVTNTNNTPNISLTVKQYNSATMQSYTMNNTNKTATNFQAQPISTTVKPASPSGTTVGGVIALGSTAIKTNVATAVKNVANSTQNNSNAKKNSSTNTSIRFERGEGTNKLNTDESKKIMEIQKALEKLGYLDTNGAYGFYGSDTEKAVNSFKDKYLHGGNKGDNRGVVGAQTLAKIQEEIAELNKSNGESSSSSKTANNGVGTSEHKVTESVSPSNNKNIDFTKVKITYNTRANSSVISSYTTNFIRSIAASSENPNVLITSTIRTPEAQASAMYNNIDKNGVKSQLDLYGAAGDKVVKVYQTEKALGKSKENILAAMIAKIKEVGPNKVSNHCYTKEEYKKMNTFDVRLKSLEKPDKFEKELNMAENDGLIKYIRENDNGCFHIQVYQKNNK